MPRPNEAQFLDKVLRGDAAAIRFVNRLFEAIQTLDDLYDRDVEVKPHRVERLTWLVLCELPADPFFGQHFILLHPLIRAGVIDWIDANALESSREAVDLQAAFILRDSICQILVHVAGIVGGDDWMREVSLDIRRHIFEDSLMDYVESVNAKEAKP